MGVASVTTNSEYNRGVEHICTENTVVWCSGHMRYECSICEAWYDDEEYALLPKSAKEVVNK